MSMLFVSITCSAESKSAYAINPRSYHTMYNYGYELSLKQRYAEAEQVMRPIGSARVDCCS